MKTPIKPFPDYKWRWAELTPSEGLNNPLRFLGVLRALYRHKGEPKGTQLLEPELEKIDREVNFMTGEDVHLARVGARNLFRNSGRYWKALGLLNNRARTIELTTLGDKLAVGKITQSEFAFHTIRTLTLPNTNIETEEEIKKWREAGISIKPLELIIEVLVCLSNEFGEEQAYLTPNELQKIVIPLAGEKADMSQYIQAIDLFRKGLLDVSDYPDCAPRSNDHRMVKEFLLFLYQYGVLEFKKGKSKNNGRYFLPSSGIDGFYEIQEKQIESELLLAIRNRPVMTDLERRRILTRAISRPQQQKFRAEILKGFNNGCILTGEKMNLVLEACHIIPVEHRGTDTINNGLCLRADLHLLCDKKHIRFRPDGFVEYSDVVQNSISYHSLPTTINIPEFTSLDALHRRYEYY